LVRHYGEPFGDTSAIPTWYLSRFTRETVTVAQSGDGGDESFAGYGHYRDIYITGMLHRLPSPLLKLVSAFLDRFSTPKLRPLRDFGRRITQPELLRYLQLVAHFPGDARMGIYSPEMRQRFAQDRIAGRLQQVLDSSTAPERVARFLELDIRTYLPDDILVKVDIASMAHSLEVRCPLLDQEVMAFAASIPLSRKLRGLSSKIVLRAAAADLVPESILNRTKKGFDLPVDRWMREDLAPMARDILLDRTASQRGLFDPPAVAHLLERHHAGESRGKQIWTLIMLEQWFRTFMDRGPV
jgi:asparagine synthase (glutamine-hydrolysing)